MKPGTLIDAGSNVMVICPHCQFAAARKPDYMIQNGQNYKCPKCVKSMHIDPSRLGNVINKIKQSHSL